MSSNELERIAKAVEAIAGKADPVFQTLLEKTGQAQERRLSTAYENLPPHDCGVTLLGKS